MNKDRRQLRSKFEPGTTRWAVRRAQWLAMGLTEEDFEKPKIAVVNSSSKLSVCYQHLDEVSRVVQEEIRRAGGVPFEIRTVAPSDFVTSAGKQGRYLMPSRDLLVNDVEVQVEGAELDAMVPLGVLRQNHARAIDGRGTAQSSLYHRFVRLSAWWNVQRTERRYRRHL